jgi:hypothetical protein
MAVVALTLTALMLFVPSAEATSKCSAAGPAFFHGRGSWACLSVNPGGTTIWVTSLTAYSTASVHYWGFFHVYDTAHLIDATGPTTYGPGSFTVMVNQNVPEGDHVCTTVWQPKRDGIHWTLVAGACLTICDQWFWCIP